MSQALESLKKAFLIGIGGAVMTAEKVKELMDELVERGELTQQEAKAFGEDLKSRAVKEREQFEGRVKEAVEGYLSKAVDSLGLVTRKEFDSVKAELDQYKQHQH